MNRIAVDYQILQDSLKRDPSGKDLERVLSDILKKNSSKTEVSVTSSEEEAKQGIVRIETYIPATVTLDITNIPASAYLED